jgi:hypothetical protein
MRRSGLFLELLRRAPLAEIVVKNENFVGNFHILCKRKHAHVCTHVQNALIFNGLVFHFL